VTVLADAMCFADLGERECPVDGELDGRAADPAGGAVDEQRASACDAELVDRARGGLERDGESGGVDEPERRGNDRAEGEQCQLGRTGAVVGDAEHAIADGHVGHGLKKIKINFLKVEGMSGTTLDMTEQAMDWQELTNLTRGQPFAVERVRLAGSGVAIEGEFEMPQLAQLNVEDQVFVTAFVRCHGSIKEMERIFGVSYPTIKSRLNRITQMLDFVETDPAPSRADIIDRLRRGEITAQQALSELEGRR
jgi:hypothetical protein